MKKSKFVLAGILICLIAISISIYKVARTKTAYQDIPAQLKYQSLAATTASGDLSAAHDSNGQASAYAAKKPLPFTDEEFSNWMNQESKQLEGRILDEKKVQADVQFQAMRLTESQLEDLKSVIENSEEAINKRIFSNY
ncbi:MAG: hypothetical protein H7235_07065, partial [Bdellovibrionaceae bacterium]|nr:hypothetical protein [Pseudobdellovibrionaceae bacterium]